MEIWIHKNARMLAIICNVFSVLALSAALIVYIPMWKNRFTSNAPPVGKMFNPLALKSPQGKEMIFIAISSNCRFCEAEAKIYLKLEKSAELLRLANIHYLMPEDQIRGRSFLQKHGLLSEASFTVSLPSLGIDKFPTIVLVDQSHKIRFSHIGALGEELHQAVLSALLTCPASDAKDDPKACASSPR